ncbi:hypothetical protein TD95_003948 [Thielaviopsis punctulata]|uniref:Peptide N-acetyl-beta-D-glucosaminyl asparaginase amidase A N-terminal domain-containing protein n=1 Tax=Thielaviopsis punctulata TaxID=72032 RepID=A0A0F4ZEG2_9PEZI|nr:hypothetical protein TD95_003948 [Thielaviopsis punctulata]
MASLYHRLVLATAALPSVSALSSVALKAIADPILIAESEHSRFGTASFEAADSNLLQCYEVAPPVSGPSGAVIYPESSSFPTHPLPSSACQSTLMEYTFAYSYGKPFVGTYTPPSCDFDSVMMNFTVTSAGVQFDRLAVMYFGDIEVWRTSTAEPTSTGIIWTYLKDMTPYLSLWKKEQKLIFDLGNIVDSTYTGTFNTTLTATFFKSSNSSSSCSSPPADLILPISADKSSQNQSSAWNSPSAIASSQATLPTNVKRAVFAISANGQANEEFWWSNVLQSDIDTFGDTAGAYLGHSPWREVQLLIDGQLAGVDWPFPVIFTGGVSPTLHRPMVGLQAFDLLEQAIDITPWLPLLCDGKTHNYTLQVMGFDDLADGSSKLITPVNSYWVLTGKIFVWLDESGNQTTGSMAGVSVGAPNITYSHSFTTDPTTHNNETLNFDINVQRQLLIESTIKTSAGEEKVRWSQIMGYSNVGNITSFGNTQLTDMLTTGRDWSYREPVDGKTSVQETVLDYTYPLKVNSQYQSLANSAYTLNVDMYQGMGRNSTGRQTFPNGLEAFGVCQASTNPVAQLSTYRNGTGSLTRESSGAGFGASDMFQNMKLGSVQGDGSYLGLFERNVRTANDSTISDDVSVASFSKSERAGESQELL